MVDTSIMNNGQKYNPNISILRIIAAIMVVSLHVLGHGGALEADRNSLAWFLEMLSLPAVNIFALITGYVYCEAQWKWKKIIPLWTEAVFYSVGLTLLLGVLGYVDISFGVIWRACLPILKNRWWYFTSYVGLFFFIPYLNKLIEAIADTTLFKNLIISIVVFLSIIPIIGHMAGSTIYDVDKGFSFFWLMALYLVGAYIRKNGIVYKGKAVKVACILGYILIAIVIWLLEWKLPAIAGEFEKYSSISIVAMGVLMMVATLSGDSSEIASTDNNDKRTYRLLKTISKTTLACYLISDHPDVREALISGCMSSFVNKPAMSFLIAYVVRVVVLILACVVIDVIRELVFARAIKMIMVEAK